MERLSQLRTRNLLEKSFISFYFFDSNNRNTETIKKLKILRSKLNSISRRSEKIMKLTRRESSTCLSKEFSTWDLKSLKSSREITARWNKENEKSSFCVLYFMYFLWGNDRYSMSYLFKKYLLFWSLFCYYCIYGQMGGTTLKVPF